MCSFLFCMVGGVKLYISKIDEHLNVPHRAYSDDSDAHRFCVSRHHGSGAKVLSLNPDISDT